MSRVLVQEYNSYMINEVAWYCGFEGTSFIVSVADASNLNDAVLSMFKEFCDDNVVFLEYRVLKCGVKQYGNERYEIEEQYKTECAYNNAYRRRKIDLYG